MFTIYGGNTEFNQWDLEQRVVDPSMVAGDKVVFLTSSGMTFHMTAHFYMGNIVADVPNKLLTVATPIVAYICGHPETMTSIPVLAQEKPEGYVCVDNCAVCENNPIFKRIDLAFYRDEEGDITPTDETLATLNGMVGDTETVYVGTFRCIDSFVAAGTYNVCDVNGLMYMVSVVFNFGSYFQAYHDYRKGEWDYTLRM